MNLADHHPASVTNTDKEFTKKHDFKDIHKIETKNYIDNSVFGYESEEKHPIYVSIKCCEEKHVDLLLIEEKGERHYVLVKDFNTFMYNHALQHRKNIFDIVYKLLVQKKY